MGLIKPGGIEIGSTVKAVLWDNSVEKFGNDIDIGGTNYTWLENNFITNSHDAGIKLVNGTQFANIRGNTIEKSGFCAIWVAPGTLNLSTRDNLITGNLINKTGQGFGQGWWDNFLPAYSPAGIILDKSETAQTRVQYNTITGNILV